MLEALDIPDVRKQVAPVSIERYHQMIDLGWFDDADVELLDGVIVTKMSKSELHIFLVNLLHQRLSQFCAEGELWVRKEDPITIRNSEPEPDISVVEGAISDFRNSKPTTAVFVVEVAISSLAIDRAKASDYAGAGVPEYWIIRPDDGVTEVRRTPVDGRYSEVVEVPAATLVESTALPGFVFDLGEALAD